MRRARWIYAAVTVLATLANNIQLTAQGQPRHHQYKLYDVGTFGGPDSIASTFAVTLTAAGAIGTADTPAHDPFDPNCISLQCHVTHAFRWQNGSTTDLGALPGNNGENSSYAFAINEGGTVVGISENGDIDPDTGYPEAVAVEWNNGSLINLGTFGGTQSLAAQNNSRGQIVGWAMNTVPDPYSAALEFVGVGGSFPGTTQIRATLWDRTGMHDLGTLGGSSAVAFTVNQAGQIAGYSYTNSDPNSTTGIPTIDPFLWEHGNMTDVGSLGGTIGYANWMNTRGQVVGQSNLAGDQTWHGFVWERGVLTDLNLGGSFASANWVSDAGDVVGTSYLSGDLVYHSFLWRHSAMTDLGAVGQDPCAIAYGVNSGHQVVGASYGQCDVSSTRRAFIWENGGPMADLNALVQAPTDLHLYVAFYIDERGRIYGLGRRPDGDRRVVILVPSGDCDQDCEQRVTASQNSNAPTGESAAGDRIAPTFGKTADWLRSGFGQRFSFSGRGVALSNR
jgi:probable HAF family extracellular repeat protein